MSATLLKSHRSAASDTRVARKQQTLKTAVSASGIGLFSGEQVTVTLKPAPENFGIVFQRTDLPSKPLIPAILEYIQAMPRTTALGRGGVMVHTVEHLLAALMGCGIDNALIEISGAEVPVFDGSSVRFVQMLTEGGKLELAEDKKVATLEEAQYWSQGEVHLIALPATEFHVSYTLHYPQSALLCSQFYSTPMNEDIFKEEIAPSRTFSVYEEVEPFIKAGLIKGGSLKNAVVIKENKVINPEGIRFPDEMVRHKVLDLLGDFSLLTCSINVHIVAIRSGHASNIAFAKNLQKHLKLENTK